MKTRLAYLVLLLGFLGNQAVLATHHSPEKNKYVLTKWNMDRGLPQSSVNSIIQSEDGYLWLATFGGLVRFDGHSFTTFSRANTPGMNSDRIFNILHGRDGTLWLTAEDGLLRFHHGVISSYQFEFESRIHGPTFVHHDGHGTVWVMVDSLAYRYENETFTVVPIERGADKIAKALQNSEGAWLIGDRRIYRTLDDSIVLMYDFSSVFDFPFRHIIEYPENSGNIFVAASEEGVLHVDRNGEFQRFSVADGLPSRYTMKFSVDKQDRLWVMSFGGVSIWNNAGTFEKVALSDSENMQFTTILEDDEGNVWLGTTSDGLIRLRPTIISTISAKDGLENEQMLSLTTLRNGTKVFATNCGGVFEWQNGQAKASYINNYLPNLCIWSVFEDSKGYIWLGSRVLYRTSSLNEPGVVLGEESGFDGLEVYSITEDARGRIWIGTFNGIFIYENGTFHHLTVRDGLSNNSVRTLFEDLDGRMWVGTTRGLNVISENQVMPVPLLLGNTSPEHAHEPYVRAIHSDEDGMYWIGTYGNGLYHMQGDIITNITTKHGLFDDIISHIVEDENGNFWMGSNRGISHVSRAHLLALIRGESSAVASFSYGMADGMISAETNGGFQPNVLTDDDGNLYFPTVRGVAVVATKRMEKNVTPPRVYIERIRTGDLDHPLGNPIKLAHNNAFLQINFTALSFRNPEKIQFRYRMEGLDQNWFDVGDRRSALYTKIPPGNYRFVVTASSGNTIWNEQGASFLVSVVPPFWKQPWFFILGVLGIGFLTYGFYYQRVSVLKRIADQKSRFANLLIESQEKERRRIALELHDSLGQQLMIIKNRAEMAQLMNDDPEEVARQLQSIIDSSKTSISEIRTITHALRPVHLEKFGLTEALEHLCEQLKNTTSLQWDWEIQPIDDAFSEDHIINLYRVVQEAVSNILRHANARRASVRVLREMDGIQIQISDDGVGSTTNQNSPLGLGVLGMQERIAALGGKFQFSSKPGSGTRILIFIPSSHHE